MSALTPFLKSNTPIFCWREVSMKYAAEISSLAFVFVICLGAQGGKADMQIKENKTIVEGKVARITPSADGWGAEADIKVDKVVPRSGYDNFIETKPGSMLRVFVPDPDGLAAGQNRRMSITVLGGPNGSRAVMQSSEKK